MNRPIWTGRRPVDGVCGEVQDLVQAAHGAFVAWSCGRGTRFARPRQRCSRCRVRRGSNLLQPLTFRQNKAQLLGALPSSCPFHRILTPSWARSNEQLVFTVNNPDFVWCKMERNGDVTTSRASIVVGLGRLTTSRAPEPLEGEPCASASVSRSDTIARTALVQ